MSKSKTAQRELARKYMIASLAAAGLSLRDIGSMMGLSAEGVRLALSSKGKRKG